MKFSHLLKFSALGISIVLFRRKKPILGTIIITDICNLTCKHCAVSNVQKAMYPYSQIKDEMNQLYNMGVRILFFSGGEPFMWQDGDKRIRDLVIEAKSIGFYIVNIVTNGTFPIDIPEANLILLSIDGGKENHNNIRGDTYDLILENIRGATSNNICLYAAINNINLYDIKEICTLAKQEPNINAASFNFHVPYSNTKHLELSVEQKKVACEILKQLIKKKYPIFNLKSAFKHITNNTFKTPCHQCVVIENGKLSTCGRCIHIKDLCQKCGYFFAAEYSLIFSGNIRVIFDMLGTYLKYV
ncbi:MAG: radical SAM protein [Defluviitaleaceae bacterium]|nr:radical SAM protein [Defluviitaleaceae bacterium]